MSGQSEFVRDSPGPSCLFLKGYKLDLQKIRSRFPRRDHQSEENYELSYIRPIMSMIPREAYLYVGCGVEPNGRLNLVLVLEDGYDRTALDGIITAPDTLPEASLNVLTPGIWPSRD